MKHVVILLISSAFLGGCASVTSKPAGEAARPADGPAVAANGQLRPRARPSGLNVTRKINRPVPPQARTAEQFDVTTAAERAEAAATGRVVFPGTGKSSAVDLIPIDGPASGGSRISLAAMRLIGAPLTDLPTIEVFKD